MCPGTGSTYCYRDHFGSFNQPLYLKTERNGISEPMYFKIGPIDEIQKLSDVHREAVAFIYNFSVTDRTVQLCRFPEAGWDTRCHGNPDTQFSGP